MHIKTCGIYLWGIICHYLRYLMHIWIENFSDALLNYKFAGLKVIVLGTKFWHIFFEIVQICNKLLWPAEQKPMTLFFRCSKMA